MYYKAKFGGRQSNALGITHGVITAVEASNEDEAIDVLYEKFEHIGYIDLELIDIEHHQAYNDSLRQTKPAYYNAEKDTIHCTDEPDYNWLKLNQ